MEILDIILGKISQALKVFAAVWMFCLALLILIDVLARGVFNVPLLGIPELIANSVVSIAFLQLPYTVRIRAMLRAEVIGSVLGETSQRVLLVIGLLTGAVFFAMIFWAGWTPMEQSWITAEYEGEGGLRVPVYPVRTIVVFCSLLAAINYVLAARGEILNKSVSGKT
jgi:TRAP-type C4-dicarboxylate transport system permease small subunit